MHVKICGITRLEDALEAARLGADYIGLIQADSPRRIGLEAARQITANLPAATKPVLLFRDAPLAEVCAAVEIVGVHWLQLHGQEPVSYLQELNRRLPAIQIIRAWEVTDQTTPSQIVEYVSDVLQDDIPLKILILDAPKGGPHPGYDCLGSASRACQDLAIEVWCAGGLTAENIAAALHAGAYQGVDTARGVERGSGMKDHLLMRQFIASARLQ